MTWLLGKSFFLIKKKSISEISFNKEVNDIKTQSWWQAITIKIIKGF